MAITQTLTKTPSSKKSIIYNTKQIGLATALSRLLGAAREVLMVRFLGAGPLSDAFFTAYKIPNSLRKIFAEGALSATFTPTFVAIIKRGPRESVSRLMTLSFLVIEGFLAGLCVVVFFKASTIIRLIAPGWYQGAEPLAQAIYAISYLKILIAFTLLLSSSALLAGALHAVNHFLVPAYAPVLLNVVFIAGLLSCLKFGLSIQALCYFILMGGLLQFALHGFMYLQYHFSIAWYTRETIDDFVKVVRKFLPCLFATSIMEINLFVGTTLATYLPAGSISLIYYANRFMGIPFGIFVTAFSTVLLPQFSRVGTYAPQRLSFYLYEAAKLIFWVTVPASIIMGMFAKKLFVTLFLSEKFSMAHVDQAAWILIAFLAGLFFFSLNKIMLNLFYARHDTKTPVFISLAAGITNYTACKLTLPIFGVVGIAMAFVAAGIVQTLLFSLILSRKFGILFFVRQFMSFVKNVSIQLMVVLSLFMSCYMLMLWLLQIMLSESLHHFFVYKLGFWLWVSPLIGLLIATMYKTRTYFKIRLYFLD